MMTKEKKSSQRPKSSNNPTSYPFRESKIKPLKRENVKIASRK